MYYKFARVHQTLRVTPAMEVLDLLVDIRGATETLETQLRARGKQSMSAFHRSVNHRTRQVGGFVAPAAVALPRYFSATPCAANTGRSASRNGFSSDHLGRIGTNWARHPSENTMNPNLTM